MPKLDGFAFKVTAMSLLTSLDQWRVDNHLRNCSKRSLGEAPQSNRKVVLPVPIFSRRSLVLISSVPLSLILPPPEYSEARERRNRKVVPLKDYLTTSIYLPITPLSNCYFLSTEHFVW